MEETKEAIVEQKETAEDITVQPESSKTEDAKGKAKNKHSNLSFIALRKIDALEKEISQLKQERVTPPATQSVKPLEANFETQESYLEALADWKAEQKVTALKQELKSDVESLKKVQQDSEENVFQGRLNESKNKYADFDDAFFNPDTPYTEVMREVVKKDADGLELGYFFGKNQEEALRIAELSIIDPTAARVEMGKIIQKLAAQPNKKKISDAPPPINPLNAHVEVVTRDPSKMSQSEYESWRRSGGGR